MFRSRLLWKLYAGPALLILATAVAAGSLAATGSVVVVAAALAAAWLLARRFTGRVLAMTRAAEAIARGATARRVPAASRDELGQLALAFNAMNDEGAAPRRRSAPIARSSRRSSRAWSRAWWRSTATSASST